MKIALLDFDAVQANSTCGVLASVGHQCHLFISSTELLQRFGREHYDALIVNLQSREDETNLVRMVREQVPASVPILCITRSSNEEDIVASLEAGANDYIIKPIRRTDLVTRILVLLRRAYPSQTDSEQFQIGPYAFDSLRGRLTIVGKPVEVTRKEFDLALLFLHNVGRPLSRAFIVETVWGGSSQQMSRTMDTHVSRVRSKLDLTPKRGFRLSPVYGLGYRLDQVSSSREEDQPSDT